MVLGIVAITWQGVQVIVERGTRYCENMARIKKGYPTLEGDLPGIVGGVVKETPYIDMTKDETPELVTPKKDYGYNN
jgi:hypothetical protein